MKSNTLSVFAAIFACTIVLGSILAIFSGKYKPWQLIGKKRSVIEIRQLKNRILVPIEINGVFCYFLWDTGADCTMISQSLVDKCGIDGSGEYTLATMYIDKVTRNFEISKAVICRFGDIELSSRLIMNNRVLKLDMDTVTIDGILGQDIISKFYWLFDFDTNTSIISNREIKQSKKPEFTLTLLKDFHSDSIVNRKPYGWLKFNNLFELTTFDSGMNGQSFGNNKVEDYSYISTDLLIAMPDSSRMEILNKLMSSLGQPRIDVSGSRTENGVSDLLYIITNSLKLNELPPAAYLITPEVDGYHKVPAIYITANFMRRFGKMYYDPIDREIKFYKSPNIDHKIYSGEYILDFVKQNF